MARKKDPALPVYAADFLFDTDVLRMDRGLEGPLLRMWLILWMHGPMSLDDLRLHAPTCRCSVDEIDELANRFLEAGDGGILFSKRMEEERQEREAVRKQRASAGRRGGAKPRA